MLVAKVAMQLAVLPTRKPIRMGLVVLFPEGIVIVVVFVADLLMLGGMLPVPLILRITVVCECGNGETEGQPKPKRDLLNTFTFALLFWGRIAAPRLNGH